MWVMEESVTENSKPKKSERRVVVKYEEKCGRKKCGCESEEECSG